MSRLLLFDIDQTLLYTGGAGIRALQKAFVEVFALGEKGAPALDLAGSTDSGILRQFVSRMGLADDSERDARFYEVYLENLERGLEGADDGFVMRGVVELLTEARQRHVLGLLTGNIRAGAALKIERFGVSGFFDMGMGAFGDDHYDRNVLGPIALERVAAKTGRNFDPAVGEVVVIGDTPKDIRCARAMGAQVVAVATGNFTVEQLAAEGADLVVEALSDVRVREFLEG